VFSVRYELGFYIQEDEILHSHYRENLKSCTFIFVFARITALISVWAGRGIAQFHIASS
jgi:hypothetical protein